MRGPRGGRERPAKVGSQRPSDSAQLRLSGQPSPQDRAADRTLVDSQRCADQTSEVRLDRMQAQFARSGSAAVVVPLALRLGANPDEHRIVVAGSKRLAGHELSQVVVRT